MKRITTVLIIIIFVLNIIPLGFLQSALAQSKNSVMEAENTTNNIEKWNIKNFKTNGKESFDDKEHKMYLNGGFYFYPHRMAEKIIITVKNINNIKDKDNSSGLDYYSILMEYYGKNPFGDYEKLITEECELRFDRWSIENKFMREFANKRLVLDLTKYDSPYPPDNMPMLPVYPWGQGLGEYYSEKSNTKMTRWMFLPEKYYDTPIEEMKLAFLDYYFTYYTGGGRITHMLLQLNCKYNNLIQFYTRDKKWEEDLATCYWYNYEIYNKPQFYYFDDMKFFDLYLKKPNEFVTPEMLYFYLLVDTAPNYGRHTIKRYSKYTLYQWNSNYVVPVYINDLEWDLKEKRDDYAYDYDRIAKLYLELNAQNKSVLKYKDFIIKKDVEQKDNRLMYIPCGYRGVDIDHRFTSVYEPWLTLDRWDDLLSTVTFKRLKKIYPQEFCEPSFTLIEYLLYKETDKTKDLYKAVYNVVYNYEDMVMPYVQATRDYTKMWLNVSKQLKEILKILNCYDDTNYDNTRSMLTPLLGLFILTIDDKIYSDVEKFIQYPMKNKYLKEWLTIDQFAYASYKKELKVFDGIILNPEKSYFKGRTVYTEGDPNTKEGLRVVIIDDIDTEQREKEFMEYDLMNWILDAYKRYKNQPQTIEKLAYYCGLFAPLWSMKNPGGLYFTGSQKEVNRKVETISTVKEIMTNNIGFTMFGINTTGEFARPFSNFLQDVINKGPKAEVQLKQKFKMNIPQIMQKYFPKQYNEYKTKSAFYVDFILNSQYYKNACKLANKKPVSWKEILNKIFSPVKQNSKKLSTSTKKSTTKSSANKKTVVSKK